MRRSLKTNSNL